MAAKTSPWKNGARVYKLRVLIPPALIVFYVLAVDRLGFVPTAAIMVMVVSLTLGARLKLAIPLAILAPIGVHLVFYKLLRVPLPRGSAADAVGLADGGTIR